MSTETFYLNGEKVIARHKKAKAIEILGELRSDFAGSLYGQYMTKGSLSDKQ